MEGTVRIVMWQCTETDLKTCYPLTSIRVVWLAYLKHEHS